MNGPGIRAVNGVMSQLQGHTVTVLTAAQAITGTLTANTATAITLVDSNGTKWTIPTEQVQAIGEAA